MAAGRRQRCCTAWCRRASVWGSSRGATCVTCCSVCRAVQRSNCQNCCRTAGRRRNGAPAKRSWTAAERAAVQAALPAKPRRTRPPLPVRSSSRRTVGPRGCPPAPSCLGKLLVHPERLLRLPIPACGSADAYSMGPRSENRGYAGHGCVPDRPRVASMGPRSENRGYAASPVPPAPPTPGFNGSTVREPWLCAAGLVWKLEIVDRFNGSTVREPWLCSRD